MTCSENTLLIVFESFMYIVHNRLSTSLFTLQQVVPSILMIVMICCLCDMFSRSLTDYSFNPYSKLTLFYSKEE